jgi:hypothetical protein
MRLTASAAIGPCSTVRDTQVEPRLRSLGGVHMERRHQEHTACDSNGHQLQPGRAPESVNHELIFRQISPLGDPTTQSMTPSSHEKSGCTQMQNSNDVASKMLWEHVLSLLVVGASVLGGSTVLLIQALPPILHGFP